ncbi:hypothetical protein EEL52_06275 [Muribaculaceae bacterium Isolate-113 (HZI)]|nr:hypothetical protein EEL53_13235 [Muribaculaceae bacterium Isolate-114 (HZI)]ROT22721.1 hypothetical protein EEL52_06275 [Muribaculaceae bacterium Isolate-113 (HZI)]
MTSLSIIAHNATIKAYGNDLTVDLDFIFDSERLNVLDEYNAKEVVEYFGAETLLEQMDDDEIVSYLEDSGYEIIKH